MSILFIIAVALKLQFAVPAEGPFRSPLPAVRDVAPSDHPFRRAKR